MSRITANREAGFTLIEVLLVSVLFLVVLGATLDTMVHFSRNNRVTELRSDQAELARTALDRQARQLRNLAKRYTVPTINKATGYDFIFQTSDPSRDWVRYCLDTSTGTANGRLWEMVSDASAVPDASSCPGNTVAWTSSGTGGSAQVVADHVTNRYVGDRPIFDFTCLNGLTPCPPVDNSLVTSVSANLWIDDDVTKDPAELRVASPVFLRNQNVTPTAAFTVTTLGTRRVFLNAATSTDPEGRTLRYYWYQAATAPSFDCAVGPSPTPTYYQGVALRYTFPTSTATGSSVLFTLVVCDPGDLKSTVTQTVVVPA